jgi:protein TonB
MNRIQPMHCATHKTAWWLRMAAALIAPVLAAGCAGAPAVKADPAPVTYTPPTRTATPREETVVHPYDPHALSVHPVPVASLSNGPALSGPSQMEINSVVEPSTASGAAEVSIVPPAAAPLPEMIRTVALPPKIDEPRAVHPIRVLYPELARKRGLQGTVEIELTVRETGAVTDARVAVSSGSPLLDEAALRPFTSARFEPARRNGEAIPHTFRQAIRFVLREAH